MEIKKPASTKIRIMLLDLTLVMSKCSDLKLMLINLTSIDSALAKSTVTFLILPSLPTVTPA